MDAVRVSGRGGLPDLGDVENGNGTPSAGEIEAAKRTNWYQTSHDEAQDSAVANHLPLGRAKALKFQLDLMHDMDQAILGKSSRFNKLVPELAELKSKQQAYLEGFQSETNYCRTSCTTQLLNAVAGANGFLLCFGAGTLTANWLGQPWMALVISPLLWTLTERLIPMIRATSWPNKHVDKDYPLIMRISSRVVRDWVRNQFGLHRKKYLVNGQTMTASQRRETLSLCKAWKGKVMTDDLPYFSYTFWYSVRTLMLTPFTTAAFQASSAFLPVSLGSLAIAGCLAGASTSLIVQAARRSAHRNENPENWRNDETLVKTISLWAAEKQVLEAKIKLLDAYGNADLSREERKSLIFTKETLMAEIYRAGMKSRALTSIVYEISRLFQIKVTPGEDESGEVAGNRISALYGFLGKTICLIPAVLFNHLVAQQYAGIKFSTGQSIGVLLALNTLLIIGFSFRKECEFPLLYLIAMVYGLVDGLNHRDGKKDKYDDNANGSDVTTNIKTKPDAVTDSATSGDASENEEAIDIKPAIAKPAFRTRHQSPDGASDSDETSSANS